MSSSNCCFLTFIQVSQEAGQVVWYSNLFQNFPKFIVIHTVKGFDIANTAKIDVFMELSCFFHDPSDVGNLISGSSAFSKTSMDIWKFMVHILLKRGLENFKHDFPGVWEVKQLYEDLQDLLELTPKKDVLFIIGNWNAKVGSQETPGVTGKFGLGLQNEAGQRLIEFCQENPLVIANTLFQQHERRLYTWTSPDTLHWNQIGYILCSQRWRSSIQSAKTRPGANCGSSWSPYCQIQA